MPGGNMHEEAGAPRLFVVHAAEDRPFVEGFLLPALALPKGAVLESTKLELGAPIVGEIARGAVSPVTVVVVSPHLLASPWAQFASELAAHHRVTAEERARMVPALLADCEQPLWLAQLVALEFRTGDREHWEAEAGKLRALLAAEDPEEREVACPYPGMRAFAEKEAALFFGREQEVEELLGRLRNGVREIYVIGPSGSGKSSLVVAGLVPALRRAPELAGGRFLVRTLRPGAEPIAALAGALEGAEEEPKGQGWAKAAVERLLARRADGDRLLLVVDQLEELFTTATRTQRAAFEKALGELRQQARVAVVLTLRADFYGALMESALWGEQQGPPARLEVLPLRGGRLREAIEAPARAHGVFCEPVLVERLLQEVAQEPGALPLLQDLLLVLWHRRTRGLMRLAEYEAMSEGGQTGLAITLRRRADAAVDELSPRRREIARRVLLRLVQFGEDGVSTRRQQRRAALAMAHESAEEIDAVIGHLADERLVTTSGGGEGEPEARIDLAHEVLLKAWPRLAEWIQSRSEDEQQRRVLEGKAAEWVTAGRGTARVLDADELRELRGWLSDDKARALGVSEEALALVERSKKEQAAQAAREAAQKRRLRRWRAAALGVLIVALGVASTLAVRAQRSSDEAKRQLARNHVAQGHALLLEGHATQAIAYFVAAREAGTEDAALRMLFRWASRGLPRLQLQHRGRVTAVAWSPQGHRVATASEDGSARVWDAASGRPVTPPLGHRDDVEAVAWSPDGRRVATASLDGSRVWDAASGRPVTPPFDHRGSIVALAWSPDGARLATGSVMSDRAAIARVWDAASGAAVTPPLEHRGTVTAVAWHPDGRRLATASLDGTARVWDAASGAAVTPPLVHRGSVVAVAWSPDGGRVATASEDGTARMWDAASGAAVRPPFEHKRGVTAVAWSPDGGQVATASEDGTAQVWDAASGRAVTPRLEHKRAVWSVAWSPDGRRLATASADGARAWDAASGAAVSPWLAHRSAVSEVAWSPDGRWVATGSWDGTARVWDATSGESAFAHERGLFAAAWSPDGRWVAAGSDDGTARVWSAATGTAVTPPLVHQGGVKAVTWSPDGRRVATASANGTARVWDAANGTAVTPWLMHQGGVRAVTWSPEGRRVATASADGTARVWDAASGAAVTPPLEHQGRVDTVAWSRDGRWLATASKGGARVWDATSGAAVTRLLEHNGQVVVEWSPDGRQVATASEDGTARVWDAASGAAVTPPLGHRRAVWAVAWSPDGRRVATASSNSTARVWEVASGAAVTPPLKHEDAVWAVAWSPDGRQVATASKDGAGRVWDVASGAAVTPPLKHEDAVWAVAWSPDGRRVATASGDGTARVWDAASGRAVTPLLAHEKAVRTVAWSPDGGRVVTVSGDGTARVWDVSEDLGTLADWRAILERSDYRLNREGVLVLRDRKAR